MELNFKYYHASRLIPVILILSLLIDFGVKELIEAILSLNWTKGFLGQEGLQLIRMPTNAGLILILLKIYDKYLWNKPVFSLLVKVPDFNGRYHGKLRSNYNNGEINKPCVIEIQQTASKISIHSYFFSEDPLNRSYSKSSTANIIEENDGFYTINFSYNNAGSQADDPVEPHAGFNILKYSDTKGRKSLHGEYFNSRKNKGTIEVFLESKDLKGKY